MLSLLGLILTFFGGVIFRVPHIPQLYNCLHSLPPFSSIKQAEKKLYVEEEELCTEDEGFNMMANALMESSQPYDSTSEYGSFREYGAEFPSPEGTVHVDFQDCKLLSIEKKDDGLLSESDFKILMAPKERTEEFDSILETGEGMTSVIMTEIPNGRFPSMVKEYKRSLVSKIGMAFLFTGVVTGVLGHLL